MLEGLFPLIPAPGSRLRHDGRNLFVGLLNALPLALGLGALTPAVALAVERAGWGLSQLAGLPVWVEAAMALVALDAWMYGWHVANHKLPLFWRFHRMHHSDNRMDASSAVRFHMGEVVLSVLLRLGVIALVGIRLEWVLLYELILLPVILLHHANLELPRPLEAVARWLFVTPDIHHVHHSRRRQETDSNYGSVFPWWDRIFRTFRIQTPDNLEYGLEGWDAPERQSLWGLLTTPFRRRR